MTAVQVGLFDVTATHRRRARPISLPEVEWRVDAHVSPLHVSPLDIELDLSEYLLGCDALGLTPHPQQLLEAAVIESGFPEVGICMPRRAGKTTGVWPVFVGRCMARPDYLVWTTAQSGLKARARFLEVAVALERMRANGVQILRGAGHEELRFHNGSRLLVVPPDSGAFRGEAADVLFFDEAQEHTPAKTEEILGAARPLMDTRPGAQLIIAGTAGQSRDGMLWDVLERGRDGRSGILEYGAPDGVDPADEAVWLGAHPGIGTLTTVETIRERFTAMRVAEFMREYLSMWPFNVTTQAIRADIWATAGDDLQLPERFALGYDVAPNQEVAAICAAWRTEKGDARILVLDHEKGDDWVAPRIHAASLKYRGVPVGYDSIGPAIAIAQRLDAARPRPKVFPQTFKDMQAACAEFMTALTAGKLRHGAQPDMDDAAASASRRPASDGSWLWGRVKSGADISPIIAATIALRTYDTHPPSAPPVF